MKNRVIIACRTLEREIQYLEEDEKNKENVERIKNYLAINGAKE